jgi:hypothetical protein
MSNRTQMGIRFLDRSALYEPMGFMIPSSKVTVRLKVQLTGSTV